MNQLFDFKRWTLLLGKHWGENRKKYLLSLVAMLALLVIWYSFMMLVEFRRPYPIEMQVATYYIGMGLAGCLFASLLFAELGSGPKGMHYLSVPASTLEKLLCGLLYGVIIFFICYTAIFYLVDFIMVNIANAMQVRWHEREPDYTAKVFKVANVFFDDYKDAGMPVYFYFLLIYLNLQAAFILGSVYFPTYSFVKTCISLLIVFLFFVFLLANVLDGIMPPGHFIDDFTAYSVSEGGPVIKGASLPGWFGVTVKFLFRYGFIPLFCFATYFRMKEKEV